MRKQVYKSRRFYWGMNSYRVRIRQSKTSDTAQELEFSS